VRGGLRLGHLAQLEPCFFTQGLAKVRSHSALMFACFTTLPQVSYSRFM
jgi:hypothetical protein